MYNNYKCSFLQLDITPNVSPKNPAFLQGMAGGLRESVSVALPLSIDMCMLEDEHYTKLLFVTADIIGFDETVVAEVRNHSAKWGIDPEGVVLNASHTHYAPGTISSMPETMGPFYENYSKQIGHLISSNLQNLYDHLEPCNIYCGMAEARIGVNRRFFQGTKVLFAPNPDGVYITATPLIKIELNSSKKKILWVNHGCHPTGMGSDTRISSDYPGFMKNALKKNGVADGVMFFQGAGGSNKEAQEREGIWKFSDNVNEVRQNGLKLAGIVKETIEKGLQPINGNFFCTKKHMLLPIKEPPKSNELMKGYCITSQASSNSYPPLSKKDRQKTSGGLPGTMLLEVQMVCLGDGPNVLTFPAEPVAELAERIQSIDGFSSNDFFLGYTNGLEGYLPTDKILHEGGYEAEQSHLVYQKPAAFTFGTEKAVVDSVEVLLNDKKQKNAGNGYGHYHQSTGQRKAFFVLSSGRCGTMTLAHLLDTAGNARVWHHPQPDPIRESLLAWWKKIKLSSTFWRMRSSVIYKSWAQGMIHGETDLLMTPFVKTISEEIPNSKFIILVREPGGFVRSGMRRNYYQGHPWDIGRLMPEEGGEEFKTWAALDQFEKVCWLWNETYSRITEMTEKLPESRKIVVKFEELTTSPETTENLFQFLELDGYDEKKIKNVLEKKLNVQQGGNFPKSIDWNKDLQEKAEKQYGKLRKIFGYKNNDEVSNKNHKLVTKNGKSKKKPKILFIEQKYQSTGGHLDHIVEALSGKYHVRYLKTLSTDQAQLGINWADIVWLEWANQMAIHATNNIKSIEKKKVVCRLHGYEVFTDMPKKINWEHVQRLIFVAKHKMDFFNSRIKNLQTPQIVIRNGVDVDKFTIAKNKKNTKKLVLLGHLNFRKGLPILLHFYQQLLIRDPSFYLYVRGEFQDPRLELAVRRMIHELGLKNKIEFVDWVEDLNAWLADKSHILSFSLEESFHYAIGNGMAAGLKPVIHAWNESREIWPNEYIFRNLDEFLKIVCENDFKPTTYRDLVFGRRLDKFRQLDEIETLLANLINQPCFETAATHPICVKPIQIIDGQNSKTVPQSSPKKNIFIFGLKRSGTTIFWKTFRKDKRLLCFDEPFSPPIREFVRLKKDHDKRIYQEYIERRELVEKYWCHVQPLEETYPELLRHHISYLKSLVAESENVCIDFTRCHMKISQLKRLFPDSLVIHLVRDPRAFITSHLKPNGRWCSPSLPEEFFTYSGSFDFWSYETLSKNVGTFGFAHERLLQLWNAFTQQAELQQPDLTIQFETFARDPEETVKLVYKGLNIDYQPLDFSGIHAPNPPFNFQSDKWEPGIERLGFTKEFLSVWD